MVLHVFCHYVNKHIDGTFRLGRTAASDGEQMQMPVGPIEQGSFHQVTDAFSDTQPIDIQQQPQDVTSDYKHYSSYATPPPGPPPGPPPVNNNNKTVRIRARSAPGKHFLRIFILQI